MAEHPDENLLGDVIPVLCGECHQEGAEVAERREIHQDSILYNYSLSIHGAGLFERGLSVTAVCTSCHTSHFILPHEDPRITLPGPAWPAIPGSRKCTRR